MYVLLLTWKMLSVTSQRANYLDVFEQTFLNLVLILCYIGLITKSGVVWKLMHNMGFFI